MHAIDPAQDLADSSATDRLQCHCSGAASPVEATEAAARATATPELGCKGETHSLLDGITRKPWNPAKTPGGVAAPAFDARPAVRA